MSTERRKEQWRKYYYRHHARHLARHRERYWRDAEKARQYRREYWRRTESVRHAKDDADPSLILTRRRRYAALRRLAPPGMSLCCWAEHYVIQQRMDRTGRYCQPCLVELRRARAYMQREVRHAV